MAKLALSSKGSILFDWTEMGVEIDAYIKTKEKITLFFFTLSEFCMQNILTTTK